jgi:large subunit ribosomal protein L18
MTVFISNKHISAQLVDDTSHKTLAYVTTVGYKGKELEGKNMTDKAAWIGAEIAKKAKTLKLTRIVMDRNGRMYHGRVKALAEAARENGMEF